MTQTELKELIFGMAGLMSVTGYTATDSDKLTKLIGGYFDEIRTDKIGNHFFIKRCGRENAPVILIDTHYDEIGMMVTDLKENGFLTVTNIGGLDTAILQAGEVIVYGKTEDGERKDIYGVVASTPPHLRKPSEANKLKDISEILIDTGYSKEELSKYVRPGTAIGFKPKYTELQNGYIAGKAFDDKACAACAVAALSELEASDMSGDVVLQLSNFEEAGAGMVGALTGAFKVEPTCALVVDVNLGRTPDTKKNETVPVGAGARIRLCPITDRRLSKALIAAAEEAGVKHQVGASGGSTGTNTNVINLAGSGIPTVDVGLPLKSMHTSSEVISLKDAESLKEIVKLFVTSEKVRAEF